MSLSTKLKRKQITLRMLPHLAKKAKLFADSLGYSFSEFIEVAVQFYVEHNKEKVHDIILDSLTTKSADNLSKQSSEDTVEEDIDDEEEITAKLS